MSVETNDRSTEMDVTVPKDHSKLSGYSVMYSQFIIFYIICQVKHAKPPGVTVPSAATMPERD